MRKRLLCLMLAVCVAIVGVCGCRKKVQQKDGTGGGFRFPIADEPSVLDPQMARDEAAVTVLCALFEGLTRLDNDGKAVPAAATWTVSEDGLTYTFTLKKSYWSTLPAEGSATQPWNEPMQVTADDFLFGIQRLVNPGIVTEASRTADSPLAAELHGIANAEAVINGDKPLEELGVKVVDDNTLTITLSAPDSNFPARLASSPFFPCNRAFFAHCMGRYGLEEQYLLSNGAFRMEAWTHEQSLLLYKHEEYHDAAAIAPEAVRFVIGVEDPVTALKEGDLAAAPLSVAQAAELDSSIRTTRLDDTVRYLWFNTNQSPLSETAIRQALRDSIEWDSINAFLEQSEETVAAGYVPPAAVVSGTETYRTADNALSRVTDTEAALANFNKGLEALDTTRVHIELLTTDDPVSVDVARYILQSWQKHLGVTVTLTTLSEPELARRVKNGNFQAALYTYTPSGLTAAENLSAFASTSPDNFTHLQDAAVDAAIDAARQGGRAEVVALEQALWQACPAIPIGFPCRYYGFAADTADIVARPFGGGRYQAPLDFREAKKFE